MNQIERDIQWLVQSPSLMTPQKNDISIIDDLGDWIKDVSGVGREEGISNSGSNLNSGESHEYRRLGLYAEWLFELWCDQHPKIQLLDRGVQVRDATTGQTLGELDFLLKLNDCYIHLEMAVKYYLATEDGSQLSMYYGPNPRDRMDKKWQKMVGQQSQWLQADNAHLCYDFQTDLPQTFLNQEWEPHILIKGMIFRQWTMESSKQKWAAEIQAQCDQGWWGYPKDWDHYLEGQMSEVRWLPLPKLRWLSPVFEQSKENLLTIDQAKNQIDASRTPQMVAGLIQQKDGNWRETTRFVIVPNQWPHYHAQLSGYITTAWDSPGVRCPRSCS
ncbi:MAG: DUF1853 family protein [Bacteroidota bacterium]